MGISRQAVNQRQKRRSAFEAKAEQIIPRAENIRTLHPGRGIEKLYWDIRPAFMGRDRFIAFMMEAGYRVKRPRNFKRTTYAGGVHYPNLIKGKQVNKPGVIWQSDTTYIRMGDKFCYATFIIDVYTKKIVGHCLSESLHATANLKALRKALARHQAPEIHHSDRGSQYSSTDYTKLLKKHSTKISMGLIAQDNAYAERVNRTIKEEYLDYWKASTYEQLKRQLDRAVYNYNHDRTHRSLKKITPAAFEKRCLQQPNLENTTITIFDDTNLLKPVNSI